MALVRSFNRLDRDQGRLHTETDANYFVIHRDGKTLLQIDTGGSDARENPGKQSQTIQLDLEGAKTLYEILGETFALRK